MRSKLFLSDQPNLREAKSGSILFTYDIAKIAKIKRVTGRQHLEESVSISCQIV